MSDPNKPEEVGYGCPPRQHQFKKGRSGNPKGRPRVRLTEAEIVAKVRDELLTITLGGKQVRVTSFEAAVRQTLNTTLKKAEPRHLEKLLQIMKQHGAQPMETRRKEAEDGANEVIQDIMNYFDRTTPDYNDPVFLNREKEEVDLISGCPNCGPQLHLRWIEEVDEPRFNRPITGIRSQFQRLKQRKCED